MLSCAASLRGSMVVVRLGGKVEGGGRRKEERERVICQFDLHVLS